MSPFSNRIYYGYWIVVAGFVTQFIAVGMTNYVVGSFMIPMTEEFNWTRAEFTASRSLGQIVIAVTGFIIGTHIDRYGGRPFVIVGAFLLAGATFSLGSINTLVEWWALNGLILTIGAAMVGNPTQQTQRSHQEMASCSWPHFASRADGDLA